MSENGTALAERFTPEQERLLWLIGSKTSLPLDEVSDQIDDVRLLVRAGRVSLVVRQFVWGLEFALALKTAVAGPQVEFAGFPALKSASRAFL